MADGTLRFRPLDSLQQSGIRTRIPHSSYFGGNDNSSSEDGIGSDDDDDDDYDDGGQDVASEDDAAFVPFGGKKQQRPKAPTPPPPVTHADQYPGIVNKFLQDSGSDDDVDSDSAHEGEEVVLSVEADASKERRLQKLLSKTDRIVSNINASMAKFMESAALAEVEAAQAAAAAEDGVVIDDEDLPGQQPAGDGPGFATMQGICSPSTSSSISSILSRDCHLRDYQQGGVEWLFSLHSQGLNGILADEMGLGKTLQVLAFLCSLWERHSIWGPHLVVMPMSVLTSWKGDLKRFCNAVDVNLHTHYGPKKERLEAFEQWRRVLYASKPKTGGKAKSPTPWKVSIVLTTYDLSIKDQTHLQKIGRGPCRWSYLIVDEAHRLKNRSSVLFDALKRTNASRRLLLTGTPLQNNLGELWSLLSFILPEIFNNMQQYEDWFNRPFELDDDDEDNDDDFGSSEILAAGKASSAKNGSATSNSGVAVLSADERNLIVTSLHRIIKPFLLRRMKVDVVQDMPLKIERTVYCPFTGLQRQVYAVIRSYVEKKEQGVSGSRGFSKGGLEPVEVQAARAEGALFQTIFGGSSAGMSFNNVLMHLRKLCNHPFLVLEDMKTIPDDIYNKYLVASSGKMCVLERLLQKLISQGHKILIFSQMTTTLDIIHGFIQHRLGLRCCRLDGTTSREAREAQLLAFNDGSHDDLPIFLLSTRAGGVGINLQAADTVIFFDSDWNPQQDLQAMSRAHRLGQRKTVLVLRLVSVGADDETPSVEERILRRAAQKLAAERVIISDGEFDMGTRHSSFSRYPQSSRLIGKEDCIMSLFAKELLDADADTASLNTDTSETSATTTHSNSDAGPDETVDMLGPSGTKDKTQRRKNDYAKLNDDAIVDACWRPSANDQRSELSSHGTPPEVCAALSLHPCTTPMDDLSLDVQATLDWKPWLGVPPGMENEVHTEKKRRKEIERGQTKRAKASSTTEDASMSLALPEEDICVLCQQPWVSAKEFSKMLGLSVAESNNKESITRLDDAKREVTMLICESCCGSYHMVCVGLYEVPENEWYCQFCQSLGGIV